MAVADEHGVEVLEQLGQTASDLASHRAEPLAQHRVGEDPQVVDLDQHRRVAEERQAPATRAPRGRCGRGRAPPWVDVAVRSGTADGAMRPGRRLGDASSNTPLDSRIRAILSFNIC